MILSTAPIRQSSVLRQIPLRNRRGEVIAAALVDDEDYERLDRYPWHRTAAGYACRWEVTNGRRHVVRMHRAVLGLKEGEFADHINGDRLDNRRANLRRATPSQNQQNRRRLPPSKSGVRNVFWIEAVKRYRVEIKVNDRAVYLGTAKTLEEGRALAEEGRRRFMTHAPESSGAAEPLPPPGRRMRPASERGGVTLHKASGRYRVQYRSTERLQISLGYFRTREEAEAALRTWREEQRTGAA